jgi:hypothetical protein
MRVKQGAFKKHKRMAVTIPEEPALIYRHHLDVLLLNVSIT